MSPARRKLILGLALLVTALLVWFAPEDETTAPPTSRNANRESEFSRIAEPSSPAQTARQTTTAAADSSLDRPSRMAAGGAVDLFKSRSWYVPPPPPPAAPAAPPPPPPAPTAPELPFGYIGQVADDQGMQIVLTRGNRVVTVSVGEEIDKNYRLESYLNGILTFVYIPLDTRQTLPTGVPQ